MPGRAYPPPSASRSPPARPIRSTCSRAKTTSRSRRWRREFAELVDEGLRAFNVERIHAGDMTTGDRLADGVASLVAAARTLPMMVPRRVVTVLQAEALLVPKRESEAATRALEQLEALLKQPEPQTTLVLVAAPRRQAQPHVQAAAEAARRIVECGVARGSGRRRAMGADARRGGAARRSIRRRRGCSPQRAGTGRQAAARRRRSAAALRARPEAITVDDVRRGRRAGGAAGRLGDDQRDRGRAGRRGAAPARADARRRRAAREDPRSARLAGAGEVSGDRAGRRAGRRSRRCSGPTWT